MDGALREGCSACGDENKRPISYNPWGALQKMEWSREGYWLYRSFSCRLFAKENHISFQYVYICPA